MTEMSAEQAAAELDRLLAEGVDGARARERRAFDDVAGPCAGSIVLFGAGRLGLRTLAGLRKHGIEPVAFADNNGELWGSSVRGVPVLSPADAAARYGSTAVFVITIWGGKKAWGEEDRMGDRVRELAALGCERVTTFGTLYWKYPDGLLPYYSVDLPHKVHEHAAEVRAAATLWADDRSRGEFVSQIRWRLHLDFDDLSGPVSQTMYFPNDLVALSDEEVFVDCGAYDGDTLAVFLEESGGRFSKFVALEPDPDNFAKLQRNRELLAHGDPRVTTHPVASGSRHERLSFVADGDAARVVSAGEDVFEVEAVPLDAFLVESAPTFLKMDIEGSEVEALRGASRIIRESAPVLAICSYHRQDDLWAIPLLIASLNPDYRFFLRPHKLEVWDLVCYGIPKARSLALATC